MTIIRKFRGVRRQQPFSSSTIETLLSYLNRTADRKVILDEIVKRYARAIVQPKDLISDERGADARYEQVRHATETAIRDGIYEVVMLRWLNRIVTESATLYTEPGAVWQYQTEGEAEDENAKKVLGTYRERSGFDVTMPVVDAYSVAVGSAAVYVTWESGRLRYQPLPISRFHVRFPATVEDDGIPRPANPLSLDDAECVTVLLDGTIDESTTSTTENTSKQLHVSWHGASDKWPRGRVVLWMGTDITALPPEPGLGVQDYTEAGFIDGADIESCCNPLTLAAEDGGSLWGAPEYPLALYYDDPLAQTDLLLRTTGLSRYDLSKEIDVAASRLTTSMLRSARGVFAISNPKGAPLPNGWDEGMVQLVRDQLLQVFSHPVENSKGGWDMLRDIMRAAAEADGVAGYLVAPDSSTEISGRALMVATAPMVRRRNARAKINSGAQARVFELERAWINTAAEGDFIDWGVAEKWTPGELTFPGDDQVQDTIRQAQYADKAIDRVESTRRALKLDTRPDAIAAIKIMLDDAKENPEHGWPGQSGPKPPQAAGTPLAMRVLARRGAKPDESQGPQGLEKEPDADPR